MTILRYFNTVGSKEGWAPKTFVSSRTNRTKDQQNAQTQRVEDFMDEEDLAQAAESRQLETSQNFAGVGEASTADGLEGFSSLFLSQEETMGVKIAQKMGWRRDQGIGRKVRRSARLDGKAAEGAAAHLFAPDDTRAMQVSRQDIHRKGLGFQSEARLGRATETGPTESSEPDLHFLQSSKKVAKKAVKKSSFGVGVLNDTGSDDEDPYELGPKITLNKIIGKDKKSKKPSKFAKAVGIDKPVFVPRKKDVAQLDTALAKRSMDGKVALPGFTLASDIAELKPRPRYPPPTIPAGWKSAKQGTANTETASYQSVADAAKASTLDAKGRSALLGEKALPGKSVFDFISKDARDRLASLSGKSDLPQGRGETAPDGHLPAANAQPKDLWTLVPPLEKSIAASALAKSATGWMPYAEDAGKRTRYVGFLELRAGLKDGLPMRSGNTSVHDWTKELQEFAHAAEVFKPTTGIMASRFTSSSASTTTGGGVEASQDSLLRQPVTKPEDPAEQAARLGMYGAMTRTSFPFHPSRLLCKRFNVKPPPDMPPDLDAGQSGFKSQTEEAVSKSAMDKMLHEVLSNGSGSQRPPWMGEAAERPVPEASQQREHATVDVEKNEALSNERASEDVFKSIFGDDDDDDDD